MVDAKEVEAKRTELIEYVARFHRDDGQAEGIERHPKVCREWLDGLFALHVELALLEDAMLIRKTTRSYTVEIKKGSAVDLKRQ